jgi:site-specific DNA recombinase
MRVEAQMRPLRAAIYARHSTDKQNPASSADQTAACQSLVEKLGGEVVATYADPEVSGYRRDRPGLMRLLSDVRNGQVDIVVCEALDRIARDCEDISWIGKKLRFDRVRLVTSTEGEIDDVKLAVAGLLGSMFLTNLQRKTLRGMKAAVLAGRLAGVFEIVQQQAEVVRRILREFADGRSSIQIATSLNQDRIPGPRGGEWNASTIRGDPKKFVGILHNPLYRGEIVWGRREWRKDPDSDRRERRYRLRDEAEWVTVGVPDLRIVDDDLASAVDAEVARRTRPNDGTPIGATNRKRHLLSGLIKCGTCGSNYTIVGKDYYRCAGNRERGTCDNDRSVRVSAVEEAALTALQSELLTPELAQVFVKEFTREVARLVSTRDEREQSIRTRLAELDIEIDNLSRNLLAGVVSKMLASMLAEREVERDALQGQLSADVSEEVKILPHPVLLRRFEQKIAGIREALNDSAVRSEAAETIRSLITRVTIDVEAGEVVADIEASASSLIDFAQNAENPLRRGVGGCSVAVVAGTGFEPVTFRL